ncbi:calcium-binding protein [Sedimentitalea sp. JM2-8]|uniref:Calcium-binding protein n=1 Tax=Sedimentitalea xiamensis TaxID=3050037 RepID=A0ABT7FGK8_9RHOB|nr:calcium-binding protein [Sedimentitalea xiamensis]
MTSETAQTHKITGSADGYIGSIDTTDSGGNANDDQSATIKLAYFAGAVRTGNGNDKITTGNGQTGYVDLVSTAGGNDTIILGSGGAGAVHASRGNDVIQVRDLFYNSEEQAVVVRGGVGTDQLSFAAFSKGVTFSLEGTGTLQEAAKDSGYFSEFGIENLVGSAKADKLTGDTGVNVLTGKGGADRIWGGDRSDTLRGDGGNDFLYGQNGADTLIGGKGADVLNGGKGKDDMRGNQGADVFVFGKQSGTDTVMDFQDGTDTLRLVGHTGGFADLTFANQNGDLKITHDNGVILLDGLAGTVLTTADFDFA